MDADFQRHLNDVLLGVERNIMAVEAADARRDPVKHKLTRIVEGRLSYRYYVQRPRRRGREVRWCWSTVRNVAGYFLGWREIETATEVKRDRWRACRRKQTLIDRALKLSEPKKH